MGRVILNGCKSSDYGSHLYCVYELEQVSTPADSILEKSAVEPRMKTWKWRIVLSVADTLLSLGLSPQFYHGLLAQSFVVYFLVRGLNLVPSAFVEVTHIYPAYHMILRSLGPWTFYVFWNSQFVNFLFWWWVGWKIDLKVASRDCGLGWSLADVILGFTLTLMVLLTFHTGEHVAMHAARIGWALALFCCSLFRLPRVWAMLRSPSAVSKSGLL